MNHRLCFASRRAILCSLALTISAVANANAGNTALVVSGAPREPITNGASYYYTSANGTFTVSEPFNTGLRVVFDGTNGQDHWDFTFTPVPLTPVAVGTYENTFRFGGPLTGTLDIAGFFIGCNQCHGRFVVHELVRELDGVVSAFHISFEESCYAAYPPLVGEILYNSSAPLPPLTRITNLDLTTFGTKGQPFKFQLTSSAHLPVYSATGLPPGLMLNFSTGEISGTPTSEGVFSVPFTVMDATNNTSASATLNITVDPPSRSHGLYTALNIIGEPGEYITKGIDSFVSSNDQFFLIFPDISGVDVQTIRSRAPVHDWHVRLGLPNNQPLVPGTYVRPIRNGFNEPGLSLDGPDRGGSNDDTGSFEILEYDYKASHLHATFEYHVEDQPTAARGTVWVRASNAITSFPQARAFAGTPFTYQIVANNAPNSFTAENLPPGLSLDSSTGIISGTPQVPNRYLVNIRAINGDRVATDKISIYVFPAAPSAPQPPPVLTISVSPAQIHEGGTAHITVSTSGPRNFDLLPRYQVIRKKSTAGDFTLSAGSFSIAAGQTTSTIDLTALTDTIQEKTESVTIKLQRGPGYKIAPGSRVTVTILDGP